MKLRSLTFWILVPCVGLSLLYIGLTLSAWWFVAQVRHIPEVAYADIALPTRWAHYQTIRGNHHIAMGLELLAQGKAAAGFQHLRIGLARAPSHRTGRLALCALLAQSGRTDLAQTALLDGLAYHRVDPDYVSILLDFLSRQAQDRQVIAICRQLMADQTLDASVRDLAAFRSVQATVFMGDYDEAERLLGQPHLQNAPAGRLLRAQIEWERGYHELALVMLRSLADELPGNESVYGQLAAYLAEAGHDEELRQRAVLNQLSHPDSIRAHLDQLNVLTRAGHARARQKGIEQVLATFQDSATALLILADYAAANGDDTLAGQIADRFTANQWPDAPAARLMAIEAGLVAGHYAEAFTRSEILLADPTLPLHYRAIATGLQGIAHYGLGDPVAGYTNLSVLLNQSELRADSLLGMAQRLLAMNHTAPARELLAHAVKVDPKNQAALTRLIELDLDLADLPTVAINLRTLLTMRRPAPAVLNRAQAMLSSDAWLFLSGRGQLLEDVRVTLTR